MPGRGEGLGGDPLSGEGTVQGEADLNSRNDRALGRAAMNEPRRAGRAGELSGQVPPPLAPRADPYHHYAGMLAKYRVGPPASHALRESGHLCYLLPSLDDKYHPSSDEG